MITKKLSLFLFLSTFTTLFGGKKIITEQPIVKEIITRESSDNPVKRCVRYAVVFSVSALFIDARYLNGRHLWNPLKKRLFPEVYNRLDQINTGVEKNALRLNELSEQTGRVEVGVTQNGEALELVKADTQYLKTGQSELQNGQTELGTSLAETKNSITQMAATLTLVQTQGQETGEAVDRLEAGQKQIADNIKILLQQEAASAQRQKSLLDNFHIDTKNLSFVGMPGQQ